MVRRNLKNKLFILFVIIGVVPLVVVLFLSGMSRISEMESAARDEMWTNTAAVDSHITDLLNTNFYVLRTVSFMPVVQRYLETKSPEDELRVAEVLKETNSIFRDKTPMVVVDHDGKQLVRTDGIRGVDISRREHFQRAIKGQDVVSNIYKSMVTGEKTIAFASPVKNSDGTVLGLVQRNFPIAAYKSFVDSMADANTSIFLMDRDGNVLAQSNEHLLGNNGERFNIPTQFVSKSMSGVFGVTRTEVNGVDSIVSYRRNSITGWPIVIVKPYSYIISRVNEEITKLALLGLFSILLISAVSYRFSGTTVKPIHDLISSVRDVAQGGGGKGVDIATDDEVEEIAEAFNAIRFARDSYRQETERDTLTGLYTKEAVGIICKKKIEMFNNPAQNYGSIAFCIVDLDDFKEVNRTYGRLFGDRVLLEFAERLRRLFRPLDCVGRMGSDEFIALVEQVTDGEEMIEKAKRVVSMASNIVIDDQPIDISTCVGIAFFPQNGGDYESVLRTARQAISMAKSKGKGNYHCITL